MVDRGDPSWIEIRMGRGGYGTVFFTLHNDQNRHQMTWDLVRIRRRHVDERDDLGHRSHSMKRSRSPTHRLVFAISRRRLSLNLRVATDILPSTITPRFWSKIASKIVSKLDCVLLCRREVSCEDATRQREGSQGRH